MRIKSNSLLAVLMAVMLILGLTPSTAFAADQKATPGTVTLTGISAPTYNKINIRWNRTSNATHYKIYYKKNRFKPMDRTCHCKRQYHKLYPYFIQNQAHCGRTEIYLHSQGLQQQI